MQIITSDSMPPSNGHYSQCIEHNGVLYLSGQLAFEPKTRTLPEGIKAQTLQALRNVESILLAAGSNKNHLLQVRIYIPDVELWGEVNEAYIEFMGDHKPARCVVPSRDLHYGSLIEIEATAFV